MQKIENSYQIILKLHENQSLLEKIQRVALR
jgi:hypothetical protein